MLELRRPRGPAPKAAPPVVERPRLVKRLRATSTPVVLLNAPSGYGKSVLLAQWGSVDPRRMESVLLGDDHNDPVLLIGSIVEALAMIEPFPAGAVSSPQDQASDLETRLLPRLAGALAERKSPFVLALDELERIESPDALRVISTLGGQIPRGSQLALASRTDPAISIGRLRAHQGLIELGRSELAMNKAEAQRLMAGLSLHPTPKQLDVLVGRTEGWPAALYLAGLALGEASDLGRAIGEFAGDDRIVVDYIREEFLEGLSRRRLEFLRRVSILDRVSGELCDRVIGRSGSASVLRDLSHSNMLLMPLDRRDEWFRFHSLLKDMLRSDLHRIEPDLEAELHSRASDWWAEHDEPDQAINHAVDGGAIARAGNLLWTNFPEYSSRGREASIQGWLDRIGSTEIGSDPYLSLTAAFDAVARGANGAADHWEAVSNELTAGIDRSPAREELFAGLTLLKATLGREGVAVMAEDASAAAEGFADSSAWISMCCMLEGVGLHLQGERDSARIRLAESARRGAVVAPTIQVLSLAQLALLAIEEDDWPAVEVLASQARAQLDRSAIQRYSVMSLGMAVSSLVSAHSGKLERAAADLRRALKLLQGLEEFAPWYLVEARVVLARAAARLDEIPLASRLLEEASRLLRQSPDAVVLEEWIEDARTGVERMSASGVTDLTPAELRVLHYMPTHLSFSEIAEAIFVSANTVKTQAQGVYRKLGVSSRRGAVDEGRRVGLIDETSPPDPGAVPKL